MANIIEEGFDGFNVFLKRIDFLKSNKNFVEWANNKNLKGSGKSDDPYILDSSIELPQKLFLSRLDLSILIEGKEFVIMDLKKCKKINLKNCKFAKLTLLKCRDLIILNSDIEILNILRSKELKFQDNIINKKFDWYGKNNNFDADVALDFFDKEELAKNMRSLYVIIPLIVFIIVLTNVIIIYTPTFSNYETVIMGNIIVGLSMILVYFIVKNTMLSPQKKRN